VQYSPSDTDPSGTNLSGTVPMVTYPSGTDIFNAVKTSPSVTDPSDTVWPVCPQIFQLQIVQVQFGYSFFWYKHLKYKSFLSRYLYLSRYLRAHHLQVETLPK
jgi:hypothetical protein